MTKDVFTEKMSECRGEQRDNRWQIIKALMGIVMVLGISFTASKFGYGCRNGTSSYENI